MASDTDIIDLSRGAVTRITAAVRKIERLPRTQTGKQLWQYQVPDPCFWAKITDREAISGGSPAGYKYAWSEVLPTEFGFADYNGGRTGTKTDYFALSLAEINGNSAGPLPNGTFVLIRASLDDDGEIRLRIIETAPGPHWGKVKTYSGGSNTVTLTPCLADGTAISGAGDIDVSITLPTSRTTCSFFGGMEGDVLAYHLKDGIAFLASVPLPYSTTRYDVYQITADAGTGGFDSVRAK